MKDDLVQSSTWLADFIITTCNAVEVLI